MQREHFIDGAWRPSLSGAMLDVVNPATEEVFHRVASGDSADIDLAVDAARRAWKSSWPRTNGRERAAYLRAIGAHISERIEELAKLEVLDNGKPYAEAKWDIEDAAGCFNYYADLAEELDFRQNALVELPDSRFVSSVLLEPIGVCGQIIPWNYPLLMAAWKVAPALAAGCTMVLKPSELTPLTALELGRIAEEVSLPAGVLNIVTGPGQAGAALSQHPGVDKLAFTGSVPTGSAVMHAAAQDIKNISLELGGKSPMIVFADADIEAAVEWVMFGVFWNQGQVCSATSRLLIERPVAGQLLERLVEESKKIRIGPGLEPEVLLGPLISEGQYTKVMKYIDRGRHCGARLLYGGTRPPGRDVGYFLEPTVFSDVPMTSELWREEIFGPVLSVRCFDQDVEAIAAANDTPYGLAAAVMTRDEERGERVARDLQSGIVWLNCSQPTFTQAPWGGVKKSGIGRELGRWGLDNYLSVKQLTRYVVNQPWGWYSSRKA